MCDSFDFDTTRLGLEKLEDCISRITKISGLSQVKLSRFSTDEISSLKGVCFAKVPKSILAP